VGTSHKSGGDHVTQDHSHASNTNRHLTGEVRHTAPAAGPSQLSSRDPEYAREQREQHESTLHKPRTIGGLGLFQNEVRNLHLADDARKINRGEGYVTGPAAVPSAQQHGTHSILEYNYRANPENKRANVDPTQYKHIHSSISKKGNQ